MVKTKHCSMLALAALCVFTLHAWTETKDAVQVSSAQADAEHVRMLIPGGQAVGVALKTQGVLVVSRVSGQTVRTPLRAGDVILSVQGKRIASAQELSRRVIEADADSVKLSVLRGGKTIELSAASPVSSVDGRRRLGVWVRDSTAGVGTLSYIDPQTMAYGALGHAIVDADTGGMLSVFDGAIMEADVVGVTRGESGRAGELKGSFLKEGRQIGSLIRNCTYGIYGVMRSQTDGWLYPQGLPVGDRRQAHEGAAQIISTVDEDGPQAYAVEILRCFDQNRPSQKGMILRVTDERLLEKTGGIVQGMSGSPIIQDGKLIGSLTHVYLSDPTQGYGMYIEWMLEQSDAIAAQEPEAAA
ncbi:MAG: SpoIVB peptidase [Clostridia bacterium]|nr:SpoIVB peptidase [Clostridia bacterium]